MKQPVVAGQANYGIFEQGCSSMLLRRLDPGRAGNDHQGNGAMPWQRDRLSSVDAE
jgi:hypothetical protein